MKKGRMPRHLWQALMPQSRQISAQPQVLQARTRQKLAQPFASQWDADHGRQAASR